MDRQPSLGAWLEGDGTRFRVWAPTIQALEVVLGPTEAEAAHSLEKESAGYFSGLIPGVGAGALYRFRVEGQGSFPDPVSRYQPQGVHGPSQVIDTAAFPWTDAGWPGHERAQLIFYELHVGTFSPEGTFEGVTRRLEYLRHLGITAVELMPSGDFPGQRGWGYDGVSIFAPARCYGKPEDLQRLVNTAHNLGLSVFLDVVYNHLGPDGNYTGVYSPYYLSKTHKNPWGDCLNFDGPHSASVRNFFIENAIYWLKEFHLDGLRLDATHAIVDESPQPFLAELATRVGEALPGRRRWLIAEDHRNLATMVQPVSQGGLGLDGIWADDFHHEMRRFLTGDHEGYYRDYSGTMADLAATLNRGWFFCGEYSTHLQGPRGSAPDGMEPSQFVLCIQNHDQIGNRAMGDRLNHNVDLATYRAASAVVLTAPQVPLLFMGQEWAASTPFLFFTDHHAELGPLVTRGRRSEFKHFKAFTDPQMQETIPDPQAEETFHASRLNWDEKEHPPHCGILGLYTALLHLRRMEPALRASSRRSHQAVAVDDATLALRLDARDGAALLVVARLKGAGRFVASDQPIFQTAAVEGWLPVLHTEEERYALDPQPPRLTVAHGRLEIDFAGPAAVLLRTLTPV